MTYSPQPNISALPSPLLAFIFLTLTIFTLSFSAQTEASPFNISHPDHKISSFAISQDSHTVVYGIESSGEPALYSSPTQGGIRKILYTPEDEIISFNVEEVKISPDSQTVVFIIEKTFAEGTETKKISDLYSMPLNGGDVVKLNTNQDPDDGYVSSFRISSDSSRVVYQATAISHTPYSKTNIFTVPIDGGSPSCISLNLTSSLFPMQYLISPDSQNVIFSAGSIWNPKWGWFISTQLFRASISGGESERIFGPLASDNGSFLMIKISPDSKRIVVGSYTQSSYDYSSYWFNFNLVSISMNGGDARVLVNKSNTVLSGAYFDISPNGKAVVYSETYDDYKEGSLSNIYSIPMAGGTPMKLNQMSSEGSERIWPIFSQDSEIIVFHTRNKELLNLYSADPLSGKSEIIMSRKNSGWSQTNYYYDISPDSQNIIVSLYNSVDDGRGLYTLPINGGQITKLSSQLSKKFMISKNSQKILFTYEDDNSKTEQVGIDNIKGGSQVNEKVGNISYTIDFITFTPNSKNIIFTLRNSADQTSLYGINVRGSIGPILPRSINLLLQEKAIP